VKRYSSLLEDTDVTTSQEKISSKIAQYEQNDNTCKKVSKYDWSFIDKTYLITCPNADPGSMRLNKAKRILDSVELLDRVQVKEFQTDDEDRIRGCYTSHITVMKDALKYLRSLDSNPNQSPKGDDWFGSLVSMIGGNVPKTSLKTSSPSVDEENKTKCILVLEDNLEFSGNLESETLQAVSEYITNSDKDADMIHLSYIPYVPNLVVKQTENERIVSLTTGQSSALGTTAYVITEKAMEKIIQEDAKYGFRAPIPDVMAEQFPDSRYSAYPTPFLRAPKTKSLVNPQLDNLREILFQPAVVSQVQNILAVTGLSTNSLLFITVAVLLSTGGIGTMGVVDAVNQYISTGSYGGNIIFLLMNVAFTTFSLGILVQGAALAPKPPKEAEDTDATAEVIP
jgi:Glycosyltransferase involved in LPS biosynthesis